MTRPPDWESVVTQIAELRAMTIVQKSEIDTLRAEVQTNREWIDRVKRRGAFVVSLATIAGSLWELFL